MNTERYREELSIIMIKITKATGEIVERVDIHANARGSGKRRSRRP